MAPELDDNSSSQQSRDSTGKYPLQAVDQSDWPKWDAFVEASPYGTLFHTTKWLATTGTPFQIYGCYDNKSLVGGVVIELLGRRIAGHSNFVTSVDKWRSSNGSPRYVLGGSLSCPYLGVVLPAPSDKYLTTLAHNRDVLRSVAVGLKKHFTTIHSKMVPAIIDMRPFISNGYSIGLRYTYRLDITDLDAVWNNMTSEKRNNIRKAERDGITIDNEGSLADVLRLVEATYDRQQRAVRFSSFVDQRDKLLRDQNRCRCFLARDRSGEFVAGVYMVWDTKCAYYPMGGYGANAIHRGAGVLAMWEAIRYARTNLSLQQFDILASNSPSIERYQRDFGGSLTAAFTISYERPSLARDMRRVVRRVTTLIGGRSAS